MALIHPPVCAFGWKAADFRLPGLDGKITSLADICGPKATLVMFICNHCPYVQSSISRIVSDVRELRQHGVGSVAIMPNDVITYPEDSLENMQAFAKTHTLPFPYLIDETQATARAYDAVCTPDFFGFNQALELQYRGRIDEGGREGGVPGARRELFEAMVTIAKTGRGPSEQVASIGCSIKWRRQT